MRPHKGKRMTANITHTLSPMPSVVERIVGSTKINAVDGRELHRSLNVGSNYTTWIYRQIADLTLEDGQDFASFVEFPSVEARENAGNLIPQSRTEFAISLDAAKHIAMATRTAQGKAVRQYFIDFEKSKNTQPDPMTLLSDPNVLRGLLGDYASKVIALESEVKSRGEVIIMLEDEIEEQDHVIEAMEPKAEFYDNFVEAEGLHTLTHVARELGQKPHAFTQALREKKILTKDRKFNVPCAKAINAGYMLVRPHVITRKSGVTESIPQTLVTSRGIAWLGKLLTSGKLDSCPQTH